MAAEAPLAPSVTNQGHDAKGRFTGHDPETVRRLKDIALKSLCRGGSITAAAKKAGWNRAELIRWRQADPEFDAACNSAMEEIADKLEAHAYERAMKNDIMTIFTLKGLRRSKWQDTPAGGVNVNIDNRSVTIGDFAAAVKMVEQQRAVTETVTDVAD